MDKIRLIVNIFAFPSTVWAIIMSIHDTVKVISDWELHRPFFLYIILLGISVLIFVNLKFINQRWNEYKEKTTPEGQLKSLTSDVYKLSEMRVNFNQTIEGAIIAVGDPGRIALAEHVIEKLNHVCGTEVPKLIIYPKFFKAIRFFVERGNIDKVKEISRGIGPYLIDGAYT